MTASFYDELTPFYHLLYGDWSLAVSDQGRALGKLLRSLGVGTELPVLDAACGIGTQTLGLIAQGYSLTASDISGRAVERLRAELLARGLHAEVNVDDIRDLTGATSESFGAILACDNSIPHLLSDAEILRAFKNCYRCLRPGGVAVLSVRDYENTPRVTPDVRPYGLRYQEGCRFLAVQVWEWDGDEYELRLYLTRESSSGECHTRLLRTTYYAVTIPRLMQLLVEAGFCDIGRRDDVLFQPVLWGRRPESSRT